VSAPYDPLLCPQEFQHEKKMKSRFCSPHPSRRVLPDTPLSSAPLLTTEYHTHVHTSVVHSPIVFASDQFLELTGYAREEVLGRNCRFLQGPDTDPKTVQEIRDAIANNREIMVKILNYKKDGKPFWNLFTLAPIQVRKKAAGGDMCVLFFMRDYFVVLYFPVVYLFYISVSLFSCVSYPGSVTLNPN
jgi:PAS domain S-box-containing protein